MITLYRGIYDVHKSKLHDTNSRIDKGVVNGMILL